MDLTELYIHNIDLHYHAGQERQPGLTVKDYIAAARMTGRRIVGLTDHLGFFWPEREPRDDFPYARSVDGLRQYRQEMDEAKADNPDMVLRFGPELGPAHALADLPEEILALSDYFILETEYGRDDTEKNTQVLVNRIREAGAFTGATGIPTFIAHPFRSPVIHRLMKRQIEPWITDIAPRQDLAYPQAALEHFFALDLSAVGAACRETGVPLDVNGGTVERVRTANPPAALQMLWAAYAVLRDAGATFVPGSDQHHIVKPSSDRWRRGQSVPWDCFDALDLTAADLPFVEALL